MDESSGTQVSTESTEPPPLSLVKPAVAHVSLRPDASAPVRSLKNDSTPSNGSSGIRGPAAPPAPNNAGTSFRLSHSDQAVFATVAALMLVLLAAYSVRATRWGTVPIEIERLPQRQFEYRIDVNSATWVEWGQLDGIGDSLARRIVADREHNGPFRSIDDLRRVRGIGPKTLERMRPWVTIGFNRKAAASVSGSGTAERPP
jgi:competence protein ComEA